MIEETERDLLRMVALAAVARAMGLRGALAPAIPEGSALQRPASVFVTWMKDGRARGRSGAAATESPLHILVAQHAVEALLHDPRVPPATARELPRYTPRISVLSTFEEISSSVRSPRSESTASWPKKESGGESSCRRTPRG